MASPPHPHSFITLITMPSLQETIVHLDDANLDVVCSYGFRDQLAVEAAGNTTIKMDPETNQRRLDGTFMTARRDAFLSHVPKAIQKTDGTRRKITMDEILNLSTRDGQKLLSEILRLHVEANAVNDEKSPKGESSKTQSETESPTR